MQVLFKSVSALVVLMALGFMLQATPASDSAQAASPPESSAAMPEHPGDSPASGAFVHEWWEVYVQWHQGGAWTFDSEQGSQKHAETRVDNLLHPGPNQPKAFNATYYHYVQ